MESLPKLINDASAFATVFDVSRETIDRLELYADMLSHWQKSINLVSATTLDQIWHRHLADSAQLLSHMPDTTMRWIDIGTGGGAPGLIVALCLADNDDIEFHLVESSTKKCAFLREVIRKVGCNARVLHGRIEDVKEEAAYDVISARALAPMIKLLGLAEPFIQNGARGLFLKGQHVDGELTTSTKCWNIEHRKSPSITDPAGSVIIVESIERVSETP